MQRKSDEEKEKRKQKKALKQIKQRETNLLRAAKMHSMRVEFTKEKKFKNTTDNIPQFNVGCSGWFYWHWKNIFYPPQMPTSKWFAHYSKNFSTVELNAPFYSWPTYNTVKSWIKQAQNKKIIYTIKVSELITHIKRFNNTKTLIKDFGFIADILGPYMGCLLFQLPPSFHYTPSRLEKILSQLEHHRRNVVEFRHNSWWNENVFNAFKKTGTIFCSSSAPRLPDTLIKTASDIYIRFHGTSTWYKHNYSRNELQSWLQKILLSHAKHVWVYFNNDRDGHAIKNAKSLLRKFKNMGS